MKRSKTFLLLITLNASSQLALHKTISYFCQILMYCPYGVLTGNCMLFNGTKCSIMSIISHASSDHSDPQAEYLINMPAISSSNQQKVLEYIYPLV